MRLMSLTLLLCAIFCLQRTGAAEKPTPAKQVPCEFKVKISSDSKESKTIRYWLFLPKDYDKQSKWPLMLFLHGAGERGSDLKQVQQWGPPKIVNEKTDFPFIVISPQCPTRTSWDPDHLTCLGHLVDDVAGEFKVDKKRIYVTGLSMGGRGTWGMICKYPRLFAAAAPICGGGKPELAPAVKHVPIWAFHGDKDSTVRLSENQDMVDAVNQAGGQAKLTIYPGVTHNSWSQTYANPKLYEWLLSHTRKF